MTLIHFKHFFTTRNLLLLLLSIHVSACKGQGSEDPTSGAKEIKEAKITPPLLTLNNHTTFPQIHTNLNGMVSEFVRTPYQDTKGNYWFGTNGDGIILYDHQTLGKITIPGISPHFRVLDIVEDHEGNIWFATSEGLMQYDGKEFTTFSTNESGQSDEIWNVTIDNSGLIWVGTTGGVSHFNGEQFIPFPLPDSKVENPKSMLSYQLVFKIIQDNTGTIWLATDGNGIFKYSNGQFTQLTTQNGLADNNVADLLMDSKGNIWIGSFYGGISQFDGKNFHHFTQEGLIEGEEAYNLYEDSKGNIWFSAEGYGTYRYDGEKFRQYTTENGLTTNVVMSIFEDDKEQIWFGTWQGICIFDGEKFMDARLKEPWTK